MDVSLKNRLLSKDHWLRLLFMIVFAAVNYFVQFVIWIIAAIQIILTFVLGSPNQNLVRFGQGISDFSYHILKFLTYNAEEKPYPFSPWPGSSKESEK